MELPKALPLLPEKAGVCDYEIGGPSIFIGIMYWKKSLG